MTTAALVRPVVACADGSTNALGAVRWAAAEAARRGVPLRIVHVVSRPLSVYAKEIAVGADVQSAFAARSADILGQALEAAEQAAPGLRPSATSVPGEVVTTLIDWSRGAELIVLGSRGLGGFAGLVVGSVGVALAGHAWCPVAVVRSQRDDADGPVVVGIDGSPASEAALAFAVEQAVSLHAPLVAVHGWQQPTWEMLHETGHARDRVDALGAQARAMVDQQLAGWVEKHPDIEVTRIVRQAGAAALLVEQASTGRLLVVGSHGHSALPGLTMGSTSQQVLRHAECPVVVVRAEQHRLAERAAMVQEV